MAKVDRVVAIVNRLQEIEAGIARLRAEADDARDELQAIIGDDEEIDTRPEQVARRRNELEVADTLMGKLYRAVVAAPGVTFTAVELATATGAASVQTVRVSLIRLAEQGMITKVCPGVYAAEPPARSRPAHQAKMGESPTAAANRFLVNLLGAPPVRPHAVTTPDASRPDFERKPR